MDLSTIVCGRLALERCQNYVNHIHAVMYLCDHDGAGLNQTAADNIRQIIGLLGQELKTGFDFLTPEEEGA